MAGHCVNLHRVFKASPEKIYRAFLTPDVIPVEMCYLGWQDSLEALKRLVEPDIRDE